MIENTSSYHALIPNKDGIPAFLKKRKRFVVWREEDGHKPPRNAKTGRLTSDQDPKGWHDFDTAWHTHESGKYDGIGYCPDDEDDVTFIDIDDGIHEGEVKPWARELIEMANTYTEYSPGGKGFKLLLIGKKPPEEWRKKITVEDGHIEIYGRNQYTTLTGQIFEERSVISNKCPLDKIYARYAPGGKPKSQNYNTGGIDQDTIIDRLHKAKGKVGELFKALYTGDVDKLAVEFPPNKKNDPFDRSSADFKLCLLIAYWTRNEKVIDAIIRDSKIYRDKWDSSRGDSTYGRRTIQKAIKEQPHHADTTGRVEPFSSLSDVNKRFFQTHIGGTVVVCEEKDDQRLDYFSSSAFRELYAGHTYQKEDKPREIAPDWLKWPGRRRYEKGFIFDPVETPKDYYNLWKGFAVEPIEGKPDPFLLHIFDNICQKDKEHFNFFIDFFADMIQHPKEKKGVALVLIGDRGTGKTFAIDQIGKLLGPHYFSTNDGNQITGRFNDHLANRLLIFADDSLWSGDKKADQILKGIITGKSLNIEAKGKGIITMPDYRRIVMATNDVEAVPAGPKERRYAVYQVGNDKLQDTKYFKTLDDYMNNGGLGRLLWFLQNRKITSNLRVNPKSAALGEQIILNLKGIPAAWYSILQEGRIDTDTVNKAPWNDPAPGPIPSKDVNKAFQDELSKAGHAYKGFPQKFAIFLAKYGVKYDNRAARFDRIGEDGKSYSTNEKAYFIPPLEECRKAFEEKIGTIVNWGNPIDEDEHY